MRHPCAICGSLGSKHDEHERAYPAEHALSELKIAGSYAHVSCLTNERDRRVDERMRPNIVATIHSAIGVNFRRSGVGQPQDPSRSPPSHRQSTIVGPLTDPLPPPDDRHP